MIWAAALVGLARRPRRPLVLAAWVAAVVAFGAAVVLSRLVVSVPPIGTEARPWTGVYLLIGFGALLLAAGAGLDGIATGIRGRSFTWLQPTAVLGAVLAGLITVLGAAWWVWAGAEGPIDRVRLDALPPYVRSAMTSPERVRVLALDLDGDQARYSVLADDLTRLGDADRGFAFGGSTIAPLETEDVVLRLATGTADSDIAPDLRNLGIGFLWVSGASEEQQSRIDNTPGLGAASGNLEATVWQLQPPATRETSVDQVLRLGRGRRSALAGRAGRRSTDAGGRGLAAGLPVAGRRSGRGRGDPPECRALVPAGPGAGPRRGRGAGGAGHPAGRGPRSDQVGAASRRGRGWRTVSDREPGSGRAARRWLTVAIAVLAVLLVGLGGTLLPIQSAAFRPSPQPLAGRTSSTCTTSPEPAATATLAAVAVRQAPGREGTLTGIPVGTEAASITLTEQGKARSWRPRRDR